MADLRDQTFSRRQFHIYKALMHHEGLPMQEAVDAVAEYEKKHPDLDMDEEMTWEQWGTQDEPDSP